MTTLPNMGLITPTLGGDSGTWDDKINAGFALIDSHDHTPGKGALVPIAGISVDDDLDMAGFSVSNTISVDFTPVSPLNTGSTRIFVSSADDELYWRTAGGTNVKLTDGNSINTTLVGGIVGDYSSTGAEVAYDDSNQQYTFKDGSTPTKKWMRLASGPVRIYEFDTTENVYVEHAVAAALASSYTVTWPAALPGGPRAIQISSAGVVSFSNTFDEITAPDFLFSSAHQLHLPSSSAVDFNATHTRQTAASGAFVKILIAASANPVVWPIQLPNRSQIVSWSIRVTKNTDNTNTIAGRLFKYEFDTATETPLGSGDTDNTNAPGDTSLDESGLTVDIGNSDEEQFYLVFTPGAGITPTPDVLFHAIVQYKRV